MLCVLSRIYDLFTRLRINVRGANAYKDISDKEQVDDGVARDDHQIAHVVRMEAELDWYTDSLVYREQDNDEVPVLFAFTLRLDHGLRKRLLHELVLLLLALLLLFATCKLQQFFLIVVAALGQVERSHVFLEAFVKALRRSNFAAWTSINELLTGHVNKRLSTPES